jgi:glycosyltransferase involved in cell wall biosynthesis
MEDSRVVLMGSVWDQHVLDSLYAGCRSYIHGHSVGGTNPSLLRAMGAGANVIAWDVVFNREVLGGAGQMFDSSATLALKIEEAEDDRERASRRGETARRRVLGAYRWDDVAFGYEKLCKDLLRS